jgi:peptide/nickel transport system substrate-binding protein
MSTLQRIRLALCLVAAAGLCAAGCAQRETSFSGPAILRVGVGVPTKSSPRSGLSFLASAMTTDTWLTTRADGRLSERLARAWSWDPDGKTLHLKLRKDVRLHDGTLLTPQMAADAMRTTVASKDYASFATVRSIQPAGDDALTLQLSEPNSFLLPDLSLVSVTVPKGTQKEGTGPFEVVRRDDQHLELRAFTQYFRGRPALDQVIVTSYPTQRNAWAELMRGSIDMLYEISPEAFDFVKAETTVRTYSFLRPYYIALVFNVRHPVLKDAEVRRALSEALDKDTLVRDGLRGRGRPADGPLTPEHWAYSPSIHPFVFDPASALTRLEGAGLKTRPVPGGRMPSRFAFNCLVFADDTRFERMAVLVQKQLADVGVDMKLVPLSQAELVPRVARGDFDAFLFEMAGSTLSFADFFWHSRDDSLFNSGYRATDAVLDRIRLARSEEEIRSGVAEFFQILHDNPPAVFLAWQETSRAVSRKFEVAGDPGRDIVPNAWHWRLVSR